MAAKSESEERQILLNNKEFDSSELIEIQRISEESTQTKLKPQIHPDIKRTFCRMDHLPNSFKQSILNGSYDEKQNELLDQKMSLFKKCGGWSLFFVAVIDICMLLLIISGMTGGDDSRWNHLSIPMVIAWCLYSMEWYFFSSISGSLKSIKSKDEIAKYLEEMRNIRPVIKWNVQCFHFELDPDDESIKEVTHQESMEYDFNLHRDDSIEFALSHFELTKLSLFKTFDFADNETKNDYEAKFKEFVDANKNADEYQHINVL